VSSSRSAGCFAAGELPRDATCNRDFFRRQALVANSPAAKHPAERDDYTNSRSLAKKSAQHATIPEKKLAAAKVLASGSPAIPYYIIEEICDSGL
jgi:pyrroline-5-carboxylate reductase